MGAVERIARGVYLVGGPEISHAEDATAFLIDFGGELVMVDCGAGRSVGRVLRNIEQADFDPAAISTLILTHGHIDHIGAAPELRKRLGCRVLIHDLDADAVESGDPVRTAADWYGIDFPPTAVDRRLKGDEEVLRFGEEILHCIHIPGHTPGSIAVWLDRDDQRILFGQDIHGPFHPAFASDIGQWRVSMGKLLALKADILCEGHFGIFHPGDRAQAYILRYLRQYD
ncbi:MAG: MBL fold metallo-hydrolase [Deltaproteobacteria bacterium]|nr:MBL fold metallo-hydrolase [Deltaproteobacteria bacterium]